MGRGGTQMQILSYLTAIIDHNRFYHIFSRGQIYFNNSFFEYT